MIPRANVATLIESTAVPGVFWSPGSQFVYNSEGHPLVMKPLGIDENRDGILNFRMEPAVEEGMNRGHLQAERAMKPESRDGAIVSDPPAKLPLDKKWIDATVARIAGPTDCLPFAQRQDAAKSAIRETMIAMDRKTHAFIEQLVQTAESQRPHVINADAIRKLAKDHGLA